MAFVKHVASRDKPAFRRTLRLWAIWCDSEWKGSCGAVVIGVEGFAAVQYNRNFYLHSCTYDEKQADEDNHHNFFRRNFLWHKGPSQTQPA